MKKQKPARAIGIVAAQRKTTPLPSGKHFLGICVVCSGVIRKDGSGHKPDCTA